jgi:uncharacterized membrane protein YccC
MPSPNTGPRLVALVLGVLVVAGVGALVLALGGPPWVALLVVAPLVGAAARVVVGAPQLAPGARQLAQRITDTDDDGGEP